MGRAELVAALRRRLPVSTLDARVRAGAARDARNPRTWERARRSMEFVLGEVRPDADIDQAVLAYLRQMRWLNEARWHDELWEPLALEGAEHLRDSTGGTLVVFLHHGPFPLIGPTLAAAGRRLEVVATSDLIHPKLPWQRRTHEIASRGCELFDVAEGSAGVQARLERGAAVVVACDVPGRTPVRFVGRDVVGSSGAVRVAWSLGVPVIGCTMHRDEDGSPFYRLDSALDPADYASTEDLLQELLSRQEEAVLAWPEAYYDPLTKWSTAPHLLRGSS